MTNKAMIARSVRLLAWATTLALASGALAQAPIDVGIGSKTKKATRKGSLFDESTLKKEEKKKPAKDPNELTKGEFDYEKFEQLSVDSRAQQLQARKSAARQKLIADMEGLLARNPRYKGKASIFFRLAETYWDETHYRYLLERATYNKKMEEFQKGVLKVQPVEPVENYQRSIDYYERVLREFPNYKRIDEVLYRIGKAALSQGKALGDRVLSNKGVQYLNRLVQNHQNSRYIPNTHLALAEHFFEANNLTLAKMNYEKIVQNYKTSGMYNYALYKLGWVYFNLREFRRTVETFQKVVREISKQKGKAIEFRDQALKDLVPAYAELERGWPEAKEYFLKEEGEKQMWKRLERLASLYVSNDKDDLAIELFGHFIASHPTDPRCIDWWEQIIDIYLKLTAMNDIEAAVVKFLAFTDERTSPWVAANKQNEEYVDKAADMGERLLLYLSNHYHQLAQKTHDQTKSKEPALPSYNKAAHYYAEFVRRYPKAKKAYIVNFYYAEILFDQLERYDDARQQYKAVISLDKKGEYVEDAALGVIYSTEELMKRTHACWQKDKWVEQPTCPLLLEPEVGEATGVKTTKERKEVTEDDVKNAQVPKKHQELHPLEQDFVMAADKYVELMELLKKDKGAKWMEKNKKGKDVPGIMYLAAATYYERGQYGKSIERLERVFNYDDQRLEAEIAVKTMVDIYARQKNWTKIEEWGRKMLARGQKHLRLFKVKDLRKYVAISVGQQAFELADRKDFEGAHEKYDAILNEFRKDEPELAATSLYNKAAIYEIQKQEKKAIETYERVVKEFKKSDVAPEAMFNIGMIYEAQTQFKDASDAFLKMADIRKNADAAQALINAGQILNALQQHEASAKAYTGFIKVADGLKDKGEDVDRLKALVPDAHMEIGRVYERMGGKGEDKAQKVYAMVAKKFTSRPELQVEALGRTISMLVEVDEAKYKAAVAKNEEAPEKKKVKLVKRSDKNRKKITSLIDAQLKIWENQAAKKGVAYLYSALGMFQAAEYLYADFYNLTLADVKKMDDLKPMLEKQATKLKEAETAYFKVIDVTAASMGKAYAAAAAFKIGLMYFRFKEDLFNAPLPKIIQKASERGFYKAEERYRQVIEQIAAPIEEQSLVALRHAINVAHNLGVYNRWSKLAGEFAARVNPAEYPTVEKDPNLPRANTAVSPNKVTNTATSAAFITSVRRGKYTVSYKPEEIAKAIKQKKAAEQKKK